MGSIPIGDSRVFHHAFSEYAGISNGPASPSSMVLEGERGEAAMVTAATGKKVVGGSSETKAAVALKSHSDAERRRRERINAHLATLRSMVPCTDKLEKAALLAEVISRIKELKSSAVETRRGFTVPSDVDEVRVEVDGVEMHSGSFSIKASLSCEDRPDLLTDLGHTLRTLQLRTTSAEISTLGGRVKNVLVMTCEGKTNEFERHLLTTSVHHALQSVLDRATAADFQPRASFSNKRRRTSPFRSLSSSS